MRHRKTAHLAVVTLALATLFGLAACQGATSDDDNQPPSSVDASLVSAQTCGDIRTRIVETTTEQILQHRYGGYYGGAVDAGRENAAGDTSAAPGSSPSDYTETNTQEEGVDEADIVKTDGDYIYAVNDNELIILKSWPPKDTSIVSRFSVGNAATSSGNIDYQSISASNLFLKGDKVAVFSHVYEDYQANRDYFRGTRISILDVSDRSSPSLLEQIELEGYMISGRMIDGNVYLVSRSQISTPVQTWEIASSDDLGLPERNGSISDFERRQLINQARPQVKQIVRDRLTGHSVLDMMPRKRLFDGQGQLASSEAAYDCHELYLTQQTSRLGVLNVSHFDFDAPEDITSTGVLAEGWTVYSSTENLYIAQSSRSWFWWGFWNRNRDAQSNIHKFTFTQGEKRPVYVASGSVRGNVLDQFSMDEHNGYLRVASTVPPEWSSDGTQARQSSNRVTVLEQQGNSLQAVGDVTGLAPGESIRSVRMMGDKGYVVTFEQIDPLFTLDLSNPTDPVVKGELKITGFSSYIHPLGEDHLMTIGRAGNQQGLTGEVQLQIFDVSDMSNPTLKHSTKISTGQWSSWSEAMWNHHAFTYHPGRDMLAFPVNIYEWSAIGGDNFSGLLVYKANAQDGFTRVGRVNHASLGNNDGRYSWWTSVRRSIFIEDHVYSLSERGMKVNGLTNPSKLYATVPF